MLQPAIDARLAELQNRDARLHQQKVGYEKTIADNIVAIDDVEKQIAELDRQKSALNDRKKEFISDRNTAESNSARLSREISDVESEISRLQKEKADDPRS